jgi:hypothetical protein
MLNEGLIKVNKELLKKIVDSYKRVIITRLYKQHKKSMANFQQEDAEILYDMDLKFFNHYKDYILESIDVSIDDLEFTFTFEIPKRLLNIENYPKIDKNINCAFAIYFNQSKMGGFFTEDVSDGYDCAIGLECTNHTTYLGKSPSGENIYSINFLIVDREIRRIEEIIGHELMHLMQIKVIKSHDLKKVEYSGDELEYDVYFSSDIEFNPHIYSELKFFINKNKDFLLDNKKIMELFKEFIGISHHPLRTSAFFNTLKRVNYKRYKIAVKIFFNELVKEIQEEINKGA